VAVTIPKKVGIKPGTKVVFKMEDNKLIYEVLKHRSPTPQDKLIINTSGAFKIKVKNLKQVLKDLKDNQYDKKISFP